MDELQLIRSFRRDTAAPDRARRDARNELLALVAAAPRSRRWRRLAVVAASLTVAAVLAASALALYDFVVGDPAPEDVTRLIVAEGTAERIGPVFAGNPDVLRQGAHGVAVLQSTKGRVLLWAAPTAGKAICYFVEFEELSKLRGSPQGDANCSYRPPPTQPAQTMPLFFVLHRATIDDTELAVIVGWTGDGVESVSLRSPEGHEQELSLFENFFVAEIPADRIPEDSQGVKAFELVGTDRAGRELRPAQVTEFIGSIWRSRGKVTGPKRTLIESKDSYGRPMKLSLIPVEDGEICIEHKTHNGTSTACGPGLRRVEKGVRVDAGLIEVHPNLVGSIVSLQGSVGPEVAALELHHQDGHVQQLPIVEGFVLHGIPRARFEDGKRPNMLLARDVTGAEIGREKVSQRLFDGAIRSGRDVAP
jgi:hypothetical protein